MRLAGVAFLALTLRVAAVLWIPTQPVSDFWSFVHLARGIVEQGGYHWAPRAPTAMFAPGYPLLLAAAFAVVGYSATLVKAISIVLSVLLVVVGALAARSLVGAGAALAAAVLLALDPRQILLSLLSATELLAAPTLFVFVWLLATSWRSERALGRALVAGVVLGVSALSRPVGGFVWVFWPVASLVAGKRPRALLAETALVLIGLYAVLLPWGTRNAIVLDRFTVSSMNAGMNLFMGNNDRATGGWTQDWLEQLAAVRPDAIGATEAQVDAIAADEGRRWIKANPLRAAQLYFAKLRTYLFVFTNFEIAYWAIFATDVSPPGSPAGDALPGPHPLKENSELVADVLRETYWLLLGLGALGAVLLAWKAWRTADRYWMASAVTLIGLTAYFPAMTSIFIVVDRYRWPMLDALTLLAGFAVVQSARGARSFLSERHQKEQPAALAREAGDRVPDRATARARSSRAR
ncbi:MAG TPA: glycosyltransferase family 39 protein [Candidatus Binatia bacterium]